MSPRATLHGEIFPFRYAFLGFFHPDHPLSGVFLFPFLSGFSPFLESVVSLVFGLSSVEVGVME